MNATEFKRDFNDKQDAILAGKIGCEECGKPATVQAVNFEEVAEPTTRFAISGICGFGKRLWNPVGPVNFLCAEHTRPFTLTALDGTVWVQQGAPDMKTKMPPPVRQESVDELTHNVLFAGGDVKPDQPMMDRIRSDWFERHGPTGAGKITFQVGGTKIDQISTTPTEIDPDFVMTPLQMVLPVGAKLTCQRPLSLLNGQMVCCNQPATVLMVNDWDPIANSELRDRVRSALEFKGRLYNPLGPFTFVCESHRGETRVPIIHDDSADTIIERGSPDPE